MIECESHLKLVRRVIGLTGKSRDIDLADLGYQKDTSLAVSNMLTSQEQRNSESNPTSP